MMIKIHKEGRGILATVTGVLIVLAVIISMLTGCNPWVIIPLSTAFLLLIIFVARFFRVPHRAQEFSDELFYSPADGKIVVIEETVEEEFFREKRLQVSVFMSVWDVHINFFPFSGKVKYYQYHPGKFLMAIHPKSSSLNERTSVVIDNGKGHQVMLRQIAGAVARRIVSYSPEGKEFRTGEELGFIKFGSRVDIFFPLGTEILVKPGEQVYGSKTPIARIA